MTGAGPTADGAVAAPDPSAGPLAGFRVLEVGSLIAAPFATRLLADLGAEVLKIEPPGGDPLRTWGPSAPTGSSWWSYAQNRGKHLACVNLQLDQGQALLQRLLGVVDVVVDNVRPDLRVRWGLSPDLVAERFPSLVYVAISGFGLTGPKADQPGFGSVAESLGGLRFVSGDPDRAPVRVGISIGDTLASLYAVIGALASLLARDRDPERRGEVVDVALTEAVFSVMESALPDYVHAGVVRARAGNRLARAAPSNVYRTLDGHYVTIGANSDSLFKALMGVMGRDELAGDPRFVDNGGRVEHQDLLDELIGDWAATLDRASLLALLSEHHIPNGPVQSVADIVADEQFLAREMFVKATDPSAPELGPIATPRAVPRLVRRPCRPSRTGGAVGRDSAVVAAWLGLSTGEYAQLVADGAVVEAAGRVPAGVPRG